MKSIRCVCTILVLFAACGGPRNGIGGGEMHTIVNVPPREPGCAIEYKNIVGSESEAYELVGSIAYDSGVNRDDPFAESSRNSVGPRACKLGGERVTFAATPPEATSQYVYFVFRAKK